MQLKTLEGSPATPALAHTHDHAPKLTRLLTRKPLHCEKRYARVLSICAIRFARNLVNGIPKAAGYKVTLVGYGKAVAPQTLLLSWLVLFGVPRFASADDFWKRKPAAQWTSAEALRLLRHSPWAKTEVVVFLRGGDQAAYSVVTGTRHCDTDANLNGTCLQRGRIEPPVDSSRQADAAPQLTPSTAFLVRWESAGPVLQAFARLQDLGEREAAAYQAPASRHPADRYVVTVKLENPGIQGFDPFAATPADKPKLLATLKTRAGVVSSIEVEFTGVGATSAVHFFFPRTIDEAPLLGSGRNAIEFTLIGASFSVRSKLLVDPGDD